MTLDLHLISKQNKESMKYMGSKAKYAKYLLPFILADRQPDQWYVEPFVGGCNMIDKVRGNRLGNDNNPYLIELLIALQKGEKFISEIPKSLYDEVRSEYYNSTGKFDKSFIGWVGFMASNGRFFEGGYSGISNTKIGTQRNYITESINGIFKQLPGILDVNFCYADYLRLTIPENSIIYCDPPYKGTKQYSTSRNFNYDVFWQWCREQKIAGHQIFISEYEAPKDFKCLLEFNAKSSLSANGQIGGNKNSIERLFTI